MYYYHATAATNSAGIAEHGLQPYSRPGANNPDRRNYISLAGTLDGANTLNNRATDIMIRVKREDVPDCVAIAGGNEYRSYSPIAVALLQFTTRRQRNEEASWGDFSR